MMRIIVGLFIVLVSLASASDTDKRFYISLGDAGLKKSLIAIPMPVAQDSVVPREFIRTIHEVMKGDAELSNLFTLLSEAAYIEKTGGIEEGSFKFTDWAPMGIDFLLKTGASLSGTQVVLKAYLYDVQKSKTIMAKKYTVSAMAPRVAAHALMDDIIFALSGEQGVFQTKVAMTCKRNGVKQLYVMDQDGAGVVEVAQDRNIKLFPAWSRDGKFITYTSFRSHGRLGMKQDLMILETRTGVSRVLFSQAGFNTGSSVWHPNGSSLLISLTGKEGARGIYSISPNGSGLRRVIQTSSFDVEPEYSHDGRSIAFSSLRAGRPMIYVTDSSGRNDKRLTWAGAYNSAPAWSPRGDKIVFQGQDQVIGFYDLFFMSPSGQNLQRLTKDQKSNENPSFSPDGRHIVFASNETGSYQLYRMNMDGTGRRQLTFPGSGGVPSGECTDPTWSPRFN